MGNTTSAGIAKKLEDLRKVINQSETELDKKKDEESKLTMELQEAQANETNQPTQPPTKRFYFFGGSKRKKNKRGSKKRKTVSSKKK